jgi:hypothetical protein
VVYSNVGLKLTIAFQCPSNELNCKATDLEEEKQRNERGVAGSEKEKERLSGK